MIEAFVSNSFDSPIVYWSGFFISLIICAFFLAATIKDDDKNLLLMLCYLSLIISVFWPLSIIAIPLIVLVIALAHFLVTLVIFIRKLRGES